MTLKARPMTQAAIERMITSRINAALTANRASRGGNAGTNLSGASGSGPTRRMEDELWNLKVKEFNIVPYTQRFNELALMCPRMVDPENVKVDAYIRGLSENIKGEVTSSKPTNLSEAVHMAHKLMEQKVASEE
ncbi:hypothetical protein Tco_1190512 [Tanacetum coccineum]